MAQYAYLSEPDPEWAKIAPSIPSFATTDVIEYRNRMSALVDALKTSLPDSRGVIVANVEIKANGVLIPCRTYVPEINTELGEKPGDRFPLFYWSFGGGFCMGGLDDNDAMLRDLARTMRITCASVAYRLAPENPFPAAIDDAYAGLKWALANADNISVDVNKGVLVGGLSAGGNLAAVIGHRSLKDDEIRGKITGQLLIVPVVVAHSAYPEKWKSELLSLEQNKDAIILSKQSMARFGEAYIGDKPENAFNPDFSPLLAPSFKGLPPTYIQIAGGDPLRDEGLLYERVLREAGVKTKMDVYPGVPHGFHILAPKFSLSKKQDADFRSAIDWLLGRSKE